MKKNESGVALIEVLVAVLIFSVGILGLIALQAKSIQLTGDAEGSTSAALLVNEAASQMYTMQNVNLPGAAPAIYAAWLAKIQNPALGGLPNGVGNIAFNAANNTSTITVTWQNSSDTQPRTYSTLVPQVAGVSNP